MFKPFRKRSIAAVICALAGLFAPACAFETDDGGVEDSVDIAQATLLEIKVDDARVSFVELGPGGLMVMARQPSGGVSPLADPAVRELNVLEQYEYWTNQPAPEVLRAAQERSIALEQEWIAAGEEPGPIAPEVLQAPEDDSSVDKLLQEEFEAMFCGNVQKCLIYVTGDREYEIRGNGIAGTVNPIYGNVKLQLRWRQASGWSNIPGWHFTVYQDEVVTYGAGIGSIIGRLFRAKVYEAQNDIYNWAHSWW